jgi:hypothetical protein
MIAREYESEKEQVREIKLNKLEQRLWNANKFISLSEKLRDKREWTENQRNSEDQKLAKFFKLACVSL